MNILVLTTGNLPMPPSQGGAVENLIQVLIDDNEVNGRHKYTVYSIYDQTAEEFSKDFKNCNYRYVKIEGIIAKLNQAIRYIINKNFPIYIGNYYIIKILKNIRKDTDGFDLVIVENAPQYIFPLRKIYKGKVILHLHNDYLNKNTKQSKKILSLYDEVFVLSNFVRKQVLTIENVKNTDIKLLYNGVDTQKIIKSKNINCDDIYLKYNLNKDDKVILFTGRIVPEKGVKELIEAFIKIAENNDHLKLVIVGSASYGKNVKDEYYKICKRIAKRIENQIIFTGYQTTEEIIKYYNLANIGVVPSIDTEGFALTIIEHMAAGNPVIISDSGGMPELINENCGLMIRRGTNFVEDLSNALQNLIEDDVLRNDLGINAIEHSKKYDIKKYIQVFNMYI